MDDNDSADVEPKLRGNARRRDHAVNSHQQRPATQKTTGRDDRDAHRRSIRALGFSIEFGLRALDRRRIWVCYHTGWKAYFHFFHGTVGHSFIELTFFDHARCVGREFERGRQSVGVRARPHRRFAGIWRDRIFELRDFKWFVPEAASWDDEREQGKRQDHQQQNENESENDNESSLRTLPCGGKERKQSKQGKQEGHRQHRH
ncbi:MAG TPA: hypothetical protein VG147_15890 [Solirubrobacteraceae bacterium]|nr:hypothetical protein [Solirubrobacteraceae bacterium]